MRNLYVPLAIAAAIAAAFPVGAATVGTNGSTVTTSSSGTTAATSTAGTPATGTVLSNRDLYMQAPAPTTSTSTTTGTSSTTGTSTPATGTDTSGAAGTNTSGTTGTNTTGDTSAASNVFPTNSASNLVGGYVAPLYGLDETTGGSGNSVVVNNSVAATARTPTPLLDRAMVDVYRRQRAQGQSMWSTAPRTNNDRTWQMPDDYTPLMPGSR